MFQHPTCWLFIHSIEHCMSMKDPTHPAHTLFNLLPSGRRYRSLHTKTARHKNSFFPIATMLLNFPPERPPPLWLFSHFSLQLRTLSYFIIPIPILHITIALLHYICTITFCTLHPAPTILI